ncbi:hypothetical protein KAJ83_12930 [Marivibrio halodurans]|uniref:Uncharacterized protein n=1 Tax=Marivibrio halodurans TaxID=2039722 RepID=A0A8J7SNV1_9PROT|nr:hypothetical protein [Marivibrio halodurans]MBP5857916.1 hypothetical protein [Marivibrio halodurans]
MSLSYKLGRSATRAASPLGFDVLTISFFVAVAGGAFFSFSFYFVPPAGVFPIVGPFLLTLLYCGAAVALLATKKRFDFEQIGDSCYYLGFLITLFSLIASLLALGGGDLGVGNRVILERFGAALSTTVIGMLARVVIVQVHRSPEDNRSMADHEMSQTMVDLSGSVRRGVEEFDAALRKASAMLTEMAEEVRTELRDGAAQQTRTVEEITRSFERALDGVTDRLSERIGTVEFEPEGFKQSLGALTTAIEEEIAKFREQLADLKKSTNQNKTAWGKLTEQVDGATERMQAAQENLKAMEMIVEGLFKGASASEQLAARLDSLNTRLEETASAMESGGNAMREQATAAQEDIDLIRKLREEMEAERRQIVTAVDDVFAQLTKAARAIVDVLR